MEALVLTTWHYHNHLYINDLHSRKLLLMFNIHSFTLSLALNTSWSFSSQANRCPACSVQPVAAFDAQVDNNVDRISASIRITFWCMRHHFGCRAGSCRRVGLQELQHAVAGFGHLDEVLLPHDLCERAVGRHRPHLGSRRARGQGISGSRSLLSSLLDGTGGVLRR
uniref:Uncharacterized protein n=1 Tax=Arundo donax TaxID=35708 RepID=A0A0A8XSW9_ARUDO